MPSRDPKRDIRSDLDIQDSGPLLVPAVPCVTSVWDAGDMACGELVMALRTRLKELSAGAILHVMATDSAAPEDLPAWCRLCGHTLVALRPPHYYIQRKGD